MTLQNLFLVFLGGGLGSVLRFLISKWLNPLFTNLFFGTLSVNIFGSLLIGFLLAYEMEELIKKPSVLFLITGFCGGFTTFSAFSAESLLLIKSNQHLLAATYISGSIILGIFAVFIGFYLARQL